MFFTSRKYVAVLDNFKGLLIVLFSFKGNGATLPVTMVAQAIPVAGQPGVAQIPIAAVAMTTMEKKEQTSPQAGSVPPPASIIPTTPLTLAAPITLTTEAATSVSQLIPSSTVTMATMSFTAAVPQNAKA